MVKTYKPDSKLSLEDSIKAVMTLAKQRNETIFADIKGIEMIIAPSMTFEIALRLHKRLMIQKCMNVNSKLKNKEGR